MIGLMYVFGYYSATLLFLGAIWPIVLIYALLAAPHSIIVTDRYVIERRGKRERLRKSVEDVASVHGFATGHWNVVTFQDGTKLKIPTQLPRGIHAAQYLASRLQAARPEATRDRRDTAVVAQTGDPHQVAVSLEQVQFPAGRCLNCGAETDRCHTSPVRKPLTLAATYLPERKFSFPMCRKCMWTRRCVGAVAWSLQIGLVFGLTVYAISHEQGLELHSMIGLGISALIAVLYVMFGWRQFDAMFLGVSARQSATEYNRATIYFKSRDVAAWVRENGTSRPK